MRRASWAIMESGTCATEADSGLVMEGMDGVRRACCDDKEVAKIMVEVEEGVRS
jgi:hypothetical protein